MFTASDIIVLDMSNIAGAVYWKDGGADAENFEENLIGRILDYVRDYPTAQTVLAWDGRSKRAQTILPTYKMGSHDPVKAEIRHRLSVLREILATLFYTLYDPEWEADELIAKFVLSTDPCDGVVVISSDRDFQQLISSHVFVLDNFRNVRDTEYVRQEWAVEPFQLPIVRAVKGDSADGLSGVGRIRQKILSEIVADCLGIDSFYVAVKLNANNLSKNERAKILEQESLVRINYNLMNLLALAPEYTYYSTPQHSLDKFLDFCDRKRLDQVSKRKELSLLVA